MFEYVDTGSMVMGGIISAMLLFGAILASGKAIHENRKTKAPYFFLGAIALLMTTIIGEGFDTKSRVENNISQFKKGGELRCSTFGTTYLISSKNGWRLHKDSFLKDSILVDVRFCEK